MKIKLPEHDHKLTNILKVLLFSLLMLLPFLDIGTRCGYVLLNKNAYQSYYGETINDETDILITNKSEFKLNNTYTFNSNTKDTSGITTAQGAYAYVMNVSNVEIIDTNLTGIPEFTRFGLYIDSSANLSISFQSPDAESVIKYFSGSNYLIFKFQYEGDNFLYDFTQIDVFYSVEYNSYSYLDNVFNYSIDKMANSPLYNWTTQTGMYTGVNAMTTGLGITTPLFAILITYWLFLTIIYIILDIVLSLFTYMTHIFTKKE